jgi:glycosyltransferase involved in cell wall biosynthesis
MTTLSVVIPAYNEQSGICTIIERVLATEQALQDVGIDTLELIVVDDGSADNTARLVLGYPQVQLIRHARNGGYGAALKTGFAAATGEWIGFLDADGTYPPEYFPRLYQAALQRDADIVIGSRMAGAASEMPLVRRVGNLLFAKLVSIISAQQITDSASGMRIFKRTLLPRLYPLPDGLNLTPVMSTRALHERVVMIEEPIPYQERIGRSKLSVVRDGMRFAQSIVWTALYYNPVRPLGLIALTALAIAGVTGLWLVLLRLQGVHSVSAFGAFALFLALVLAVAGVSILALGISFNYFVALFHRLPIRQGLFIKPFATLKLEKHFGVIGVGALSAGLLLAFISLALALSGWSVTQLWLYYLTSACLSLMGIQFIIAWVQMQILDTLRLREQLVADDMQGQEVTPPASIPSASMPTAPMPAHTLLTTKTV